MLIRLSVVALFLSLLAPVGSQAVSATCDPVTKTCTATFTQAEFAILQRALTQHGPTWLAEVLRNHLADRKRAFATSDLDADKYEARTPEVQQTIRNYLACGQATCP